METAKILLGWLALNLFLLAVIVLIWVWWRHSRPLIGSELARKLKNISDADPQRPDCTFGELAFLLRETGRPSEETLLCALLTKWREEGRIACEMAPKKRLSGYGEDIQPTLTLRGDETGASGKTKLSGAEKVLFDLFADACAETLQSSEGYDWARRNAEPLHHCLLRFETEGRARLRAEGAVREETKKPLFGVSRPERLIYTPRGLRRAEALRRWENHLRTAPEDCLPHTVLLGIEEPPQPLAMYCERLLQGYHSGKALQKAH